MNFTSTSDVRRENVLWL